MFKERLVSGIIVVLGMAGMLLAGGWVMLLALWAISMIGLLEYQKAISSGVWKVEWRHIWSFIACSLVYGALIWGQGAILIGIILIYFLGLLIGYVITYPQYTLANIAESFFGFIYVPCMLLFVYMTRSFPKGEYLVWLIVICSWGCDTFAYCVGMLIGKHKMAPILSPKKSIEGAIGGLIGSSLLSILLGYIAMREMSVIHIGMVSIGVIGLIGGLVSMVGDLAASAIKREYQIKDYGHLIPGHGGILDRFDSMIMIAPAIYVLCRILYFV